MDPLCNSRRNEHRGSQECQARHSLCRTARENGPHHPHDIYEIVQVMTPTIISINFLKREEGVGEEAN